MSSARKAADPLHVSELCVRLALSERQAAHLVSSLLSLGCCALCVLAGVVVRAAESFVTVDAADAGSER
eukprot:6778912-Prymnesium_polylepis.1